MKFHTHVAAMLAFMTSATALLGHPALAPSSDYTNPGNDKYHHTIKSKIAPYTKGKIPSECARIAKNEKLKPADFKNYYVKYEDCADPWVFCNHKNSKSSIDDLVKNFGRVPVGMRDYVKHVVGLTAGNGAYNDAGNIALFDTAGTALFNIWLHESGHSLDLQGALTGDASKFYSSSKGWLDAYNKDKYVPDDYSRNNQIENFAQNTVIAIFDKVVPGGFPKIQPKYKGIVHQYQNLQKKAGKRILQGGKCNRALKPSNPIPVNGTSTSRIEGHPQSQDFSQQYSNLREANPYSTRQEGQGWANDIDEADEIEIESSDA